MKDNKAQLPNDELVENMCCAICQSDCQNQFDTSKNVCSYVLSQIKLILPLIAAHDVQVRKDTAEELLKESAYIKPFKCYSVQKDCINMDSYGEICVGCGCCSKDNNIRWPARLKMYQEHLERSMSFNHWMEGTIRLQKRNQKANITYNKRRIAIYKRLCATLTPND